MNLQMLLSVYTVFLTAPGAALLVVPSVVFSRLYGAQPLDVLEISLARSIGALAIGLGVMCWTARTAEASKARDALILGLTVVNGLGVVVTVLAGMAGGGNWLIWTEAALLALFTVLFIVTSGQAMSAPTAGGGTSTRM